MTTPEERYDLTVKITEVLTQLRQDFRDVGIWTEIEHKSLSTLMASASLAMNILDPDKFSVYVDEFNAKIGLTDEGKQKDEGPAKTGHYL